MTLVLFLVAALGPLDHPPKADKKPHTTPLHGEMLQDDYFWLREKGTKNVERYLKAENAYADKALKPLEPSIVALESEMKSRIAPDESLPADRFGAFEYYARFEHGKEYPIWERRPVGGGEAQLVVDVNKLGSGKQFAAISTPMASDDGKLVSYGFDWTGHRDYELNVVDIATQKRVWKGPSQVTARAWAADSKTLLYVVEEKASKRPYQVWRFTLGEKAPHLVYEEKDSNYSVTLDRTRSGAYLIIYAYAKATSEARFVDAHKPDAAWTIVREREVNIEYDVEHRGDTFWVRHNLDGPNFGLSKANVATPTQWVTVFKPDPNVVFDGIMSFASFDVRFARIKGLTSLIVVDAASGKETPITFPDKAYECSPAANLEFSSKTFRYIYDSPLLAKTYFDFDTEKKVSTKVGAIMTPNFDASLHTTDRIFIKVRDGVEVPVSLTYRQNLDRKKPHPLYLIGYGSYGVTNDAHFDMAMLSLIDRGVIVATAHIRGGGELGRQWYEDGRLSKKQNTFNDFIDTCDALVAQGWTTREQLGIFGASAGGLLIGAVVTQRPDIAKLAVLGVPFVDILNTMLDETLPLTTGEFTEWGNPKVKADFEVMRQYSPYDNVKAAGYPWLYVFGSYNDSQVPYWEPAKLTAKLRALKTDSNPLLQRISLEPSGHGGKAGRYAKLHEKAIQVAIVLEAIAQPAVSGK